MRGAYRGDERNAQEPLDAADHTGPLDRQIQGAFEFVRNNMRIEAVKQLGRIDIPQYHLGAVYEASVNAVAHRDYAMAGSRIRLHRFADHLQLASPGLLPNNLTIDGLSEDTVTRNETVVNLLSRYYRAEPEAERDRPSERRILHESGQQSAMRPEYRIVGDRELVLTIWAASRERNGLVQRTCREIADAKTHFARSQGLRGNAGLASSCRPFRLFGQLEPPRPIRRRPGLRVGRGAQRPRMRQVNPECFPWLLHRQVRP